MKQLILLLILCLIAATANAAVEFQRGQAAYVVSNPKTDLEKNLTADLTDYLTKVLKQPPKVVGNISKVPNGSPAIVLCSGSKDLPLDVNIPAGSPEAFAVVTGKKNGYSIVMAAGDCDMGLKQAVHRMVIKSRQEPNSLVFDELKIIESPWIPQREYTISYWSPQLVRGIYANPAADLRMDIYRYGDNQLERYADMFDWFGFNGCQLTETCNDYASFGTIEAEQDWQITMAKHIKNNGQKVSLFAWAACFTGYGWSDPTAHYHPAPGKSVIDDPRVRATFEKYYTIYANLAPYVDLLIPHCYDPGHLEVGEDLKFYLNLLEKKFKERNPNIQMGVTTWGKGPDYLKWLAENGFEDYRLLANNMPVFYQPGDREKIHETAKELGLNLGIWGWWITECESDQLASMYVTARLLKNFYQQLKNGVMQIYPVTYWSEMESNHLVNIYSLYAAGQLLFNPDRDPDELLQEITEAIWGPVNGPKVCEALMLIQDLRSGDTWQPYWWGLGEYNMGSGDPKKDLDRAIGVIKKIENIEIDPDFVTKIPLPVTPADLLDLIVPHVKQIKLFCQFRCDYDQIKTAAEKGESPDKLKQMLTDAWQPIPEYNTWIGNFGQIERRLQRKMVHALAGELKIEIRDPEPYRYIQADRLYQYIKNVQKDSDTPVHFKETDYNFGLWTEEHIKDRFAKLREMGLIVHEREDYYRLADWQTFANPRAKIRSPKPQQKDGIMNLGADKPELE